MQFETTARSIDAFRKEPHLLRLECGIQHYDWGDREAIPEMLGTQNPTGKPFAELWAGAHPDLPASALLDGVRVPLDELIAGTPSQILGESVARRFGGELPFLLKILAAGKPLSIQAHPNEAQARAGFERENRAGLPLEAATRSYHDPHHKPELLVALTDFYSLRGFRPPDDIARVLAETQELAPLDDYFRVCDLTLEPLYAHIMHLRQEQVNELLSPLIERLARANPHRPFPRDTWQYWLLRADREFSLPGYRDHGLFSVLLLNLVHLRPGQAIYLPAGELHAYLQGVGIELMANSNNVLRGGLTHKHVSVDELLRTLSFRAAPADLIEGLTSPDRPGLTSYPTPAGEFALCRLELPAGREHARTNGETTLVLLTGGRIEAIQASQAPLSLGPGDALLAPAHVSWRLRAMEDTVCWLAHVPPNREETPPARQVVL